MTRDHLVRFHRRVESGRDAFNAPQVTWPVVFSAWAHVKWLGADEGESEGQIGDVVRLVVTVLDSAQARSLSGRDRVRVDGADYQVTGVHAGRSRAYRKISARGPIT